MATFLKVAALSSRGLSAAHIQQEKILRGEVQIVFIGPELLMLRNAEDTCLQEQPGCLCSR